MEIVIEINGVRHRQVKSLHEMPECGSCSLECKCPLSTYMGESGLCEILGEGLDYHFEAVE